VKDTKRIQVLIYGSPPLVLGGAGAYKVLTSGGKVLYSFKDVMGEIFDVETFSWIKRAATKLSLRKVYIIDAPLIIYYLINKARDKDIIIASGYPALLELLVLFFISKLRRIPLLVRETHWYWPQTKLSKFLWHLYYKILKNVDGLLVPGKASFKYWKRHFNNVYIVHYYALEASMPKCEASTDELKKRIGIPTDAKVILYLGRLIKKKGVDIIIKAYAKLVKERKDLRAALVIVGEGSEKEKLEELSIKLGVRNTTYFLGAISESLKQCIYRLADVFVYVPIIEVIPEEWPIAPLEALSLGIPTIVSTAVGSLPEIANAVIIVKSGDVEDLYIALCRILENSDLRRRLREKAIHIYSRLTSIPNIKLEILMAVLDVLKKRRAGTFS